MSLMLAPSVQDVEDGDDGDECLSVQPDTYVYATAETRVLKEDDIEDAGPPEVNRVQFVEDGNKSVSRQPQTLSGTHTRMPLSSRMKRSFVTFFRPLFANNRKAHRPAHLEAYHAVDEHEMAVAIPSQYIYIKCTTFSASRLADTTSSTLKIKRL